MDRLPQKFHQYDKSNRHFGVIIQKEDHHQDDNSNNHQLNDEEKANTTTTPIKDEEKEKEEDDGIIPDSNKSDNIILDERLLLVVEKESPMKEKTVNKDGVLVEEGISVFNNNKKEQQQQENKKEVGNDTTRDETKTSYFQRSSGPGGIFPVSSRKYWGGPFYERFDDVDHDFDEYARNNQPFEGIHEVFAAESGIVRRFIWFIWWGGIGIIFIYGAIPDIHDYQNNASTTNVKTSTSIKGLPLPVTTICPVGSGIRCDCQLWTILACEYNDGSDISYYFRSLLCALPPWNFDVSNTTLLSICNDDASTSTLSTITTINWNNDSCGKTNSLLDGQTLYQRVQQRASSTTGPFITKEELIAYGGLQYDTTNLLVLMQSSSNRIPELISNNYINYNYFDLLQGKICAQIRIPPNIRKQTSTGIDTGYNIFANETFERISSVEYLGFDIFLNSNIKSYNLDKYIYTIPEGTMPIPAGQLSYIGLQLQSLSRKQGYGDEASKTCITNGDPREVCVNKVSIKQMSQSCQNCLDTTEFASYYNLTGQQAIEYNVYGCDASCFAYLSDDESPATTIQDCPFLCETNTSNIAVNQQVPQSTWYKQFFLQGPGSSNNVSSITNAFVGYTSFDITEVVESPAKTLASLTGEMGGNFNLWFGPNFMTLLLLVEMLAIGMVVSKCKRLVCFRSSS